MFTFTEDYQKRIDIFKKIFPRECLFCGITVRDLPINKTVLKICETCLNKFEVLEELKLPNSKEIIEEISKCWQGKCYFCYKQTIKWDVSFDITKKLNIVTDGFFGEYVLDKIQVCHSCHSKFHSFCDFEQEKKRLEMEQNLQTRMEIPVRNND